MLQRNSKSLNLLLKQEHPYNSYNTIEGNFENRFVVVEVPNFAQSARLQHYSFNCYMSSREKCHSFKQVVPPR